MRELNKKSGKIYYFAFESFGVKIRFSSSDGEVVEAVEKEFKKILPTELYSEISYSRSKHNFSIRSGKRAKYSFFKGREKITYSDELNGFSRFIESYLRMTIAEFAENKVFLHAGVVGWKGKAIIIPAKSFGGKTTLVRELTKRGATYYSDDYAVLDKDGLVHPFPKALSLRGIIDEYQQLEVSVEELGGQKGNEPLPVGMILFSEYATGAKWEPVYLNAGSGILDLISYTIPIRYNPKFSLNVLNKTIKRAIIVKSERGDAKDFAVELLRFFENKAF